MYFPPQSISIQHNLTRPVWLALAPALSTFNNSCPSTIVAVLSILFCKILSILLYSTTCLWSCPLPKRFLNVLFLLTKLQSAQVSQPLIRLMLHSFIKWSSCLIFFYLEGLALCKHSQAIELFKYDSNCICWFCLWRAAILPYCVESVNLLGQSFPNLSLSWTTSSTAFCRKVCSGTSDRISHLPC